jgi:hypothetical protein
MRVNEFTMPAQQHQNPQDPEMNDRIGFERNCLIPRLLSCHDVFPVDRVHHPDNCDTMRRSEIVYDIFKGCVAKTFLPHWVPSLSRR